MLAFIPHSIRLFLALAVLAQASTALAQSPGGQSGQDQGKDQGQEPVELEPTMIYTQAPEATRYRYGMKLDIEQVHRIDYYPPEPRFCGVIPARMTYEDSQGQLNILEYLYPETSGCGN